MTAWILDQFGGIAPRFDGRRLPETWAAEATNIDPLAPALAPLPAPNFIEAAGTNDNSLYYYNDAWIYSNNHRDYVRTFQHNDVDDKVYYSDYPNRPKIRSSGSIYNLGQPTPEPLTFGTITVGDVTDETLNETWIYTYTYVDSFGFESAASDPVSAGEVGVGASVALDFPALPTGSGINIDKVYVYRSNVGSSEADFQFLVSLDAVTATGAGHTDTKLSSELEEVLEAFTNIPPPSETDPDGSLKSLVSFAGNILVGHTKRTVCLSRPGLPHAWPEQNRYPVPEEIIAIIDAQSGVLVLTGKAVYMLFGSSPDAMQLERLPSEQNCLAARSVVRLDNRIYWASTDGLVVYENGAVRVLTSDIVTREQWLADYAPDSIYAFAHEGTYVAMGTERFIYVPGAEARRLTRFSFPQTLKGVHRREDDDRTYLLLDDGAGTQGLYTWREGADQTYTWTTKLKQFARPSALSCFRVYSSETGTIDMTLTLDGEDLVSGTIPLNELIRLPIRTKARLWQITLSGTARVEVLVTADNMTEMV